MKEPKLCMYCHQPLGDEAHPDDAPEGHLACWMKRPDVKAMLDRSARIADERDGGRPPRSKS